MLNISDLHVSYGKRAILHGVSLSCQPGKITVIIGPNGCGKSTMLKAIAGVTPMERGEIRLDEDSLSALSDLQRARRIAYLAQGKSIPEITAGRMVLHGRFPYLSYPRNYRAQDFAITKQAMKQMGIEAYAHRSMGELSGGMRQKVYIAMALAQQSDVILMDEPTTYLDIAQQFKLAKTIRELAESGKTILLVLHDILLALKLADQIAVMQDGYIRDCTTPSALCESTLLQEIFQIGIQTITVKDRLEYFYETEELL